MKARPALVIMGDGSREMIPNDVWARYISRLCEFYPQKVI